MSVSIGSNSNGDLEIYTGITKILTADAETGVVNFDNGANFKNTVNFDNANFKNGATAPTVAAGTNDNQVATTAFAMGAGLGSNQSWKDVASSRVLNTTYTNTTGKPIMIIISIANSGNDLQHNIYVNGVGVGVQVLRGTSVVSALVAVVPAGGTYYTAANTGGSGTLSITSWMELK
jgi:hypothetical protein